MEAGATIVNGKVFHVIGANQGHQPSVFSVRDGRTGELLWSLDLPLGTRVHTGLTVVASRARAYVPFSGYERPGGILAIDLARHEVAWERQLPPERYTWGENSAISALTADASRLYVFGATRTLIAYRLSDGAQAWSVPLTFDAGGHEHVVDGVAVGDGVVFTGGSEGLVAYAATTGRRLWTGAGRGLPVVAGGRVFSALPDGIAAFRASGCGASRCSAVWTQRFGGRVEVAPKVGGATASILFATYQDRLTLDFSVARIAASSGRVGWTAPAGIYAGHPVRAGDSLWFVYAALGPNGSHDPGFLGFSAFAQTSEPLTAIEHVPAAHGFHGGIAVASGTLVVQKASGWLTAYRVPGT